MKNIERKGEIARYDEQFLLFPQCFSVFFFFYRIDKLPSILTTSEFVDCKFFQFETVQNVSSDIFVKELMTPILTYPVNIYKGRSK